MRKPLTGATSVSSGSLHHFKSDISTTIGSKLEFFATYAGSTSRCLASMAAAFSLSLDHESLGQGIPWGPQAAVASTTQMEPFLILLPCSVARYCFLGGAYSKKLTSGRDKLVRRTRKETSGGSRKHRSRDCLISITDCGLIATRNAISVSKRVNEHISSEP